MIMIISACSNKSEKYDNEEYSYNMNKHYDAGEMFSVEPIRIIVNNREIQNTLGLIPNGNHIPSHIPLMVVVNELGADVTYTIGGRYENLLCIICRDMIAQEELENEGMFLIYGRNGHIAFTANPTSIFFVDGNAVEIPGMHTVVVNQIIYMPIMFYSHVFGVENVYYRDGAVYIYD